jgi:hypothetical protein
MDRLETVGGEHAGKRTSGTCIQDATPFGNQCRNKAEVAEHNLAWLWRGKLRTGTRLDSQRTRVSKPRTNSHRVAGFFLRFSSTRPKEAESLAKISGNDVRIGGARRVRKEQCRRDTGGA